MQPRAFGEQPVLRRGRVGEQVACSLRAEHLGGSRGGAVEVERGVDAHAGEQGFRFGSRVVAGEVGAAKVGLDRLGEPLGEQAPDAGAGCHPVAGAHPGDGSAEVAEQLPHRAGRARGVHVRDADGTGLDAVEQNRVREPRVVRHHQRVHPREELGVGAAGEVPDLDAAVDRIDLDARERRAFDPHAVLDGERAAHLVVLGRDGANRVGVVGDDGVFGDDDAAAIRAEPGEGVADGPSGGLDGRHRVDRRERSAQAAGRGERLRADDILDPLSVRRHVPAQHALLGELERRRREHDPLTGRDPVLVDHVHLHLGEPLRGEFLAGFGDAADERRRDQRRPFGQLRRLCAVPAGGGKRCAPDGLRGRGDRLERCGRLLGGCLLAVAFLAVPVAFAVVALGRLGLSIDARAGAERLEFVVEVLLGGGPLGLLRSDLLDRGDAGLHLLDDLFGGAVAERVGVLRLHVAGDGLELVLQFGEFVVGERGEVCRKLGEHARIGRCHESPPDAK